MRKVALLTVVDRIVYQAILNYEVLGQILFNNWSSACYSPNISKSKLSYFENYQDCWDKFITDQISAFDDGFYWRLEFDIETFYDSIDHKKLRSILVKDCNIKHDGVLHLLFRLLSTWTNHPNKGLPQGPNPSSALANIYLTTVDNEVFLDEENVRLFRYVDDFVLMSKSKNELFEVFESLNYKVVELGLNLNTKSKLIKMTDKYDLENKRFSTSYSNDVPISLQKLMDITPEIPYTVNAILEDKYVEHGQMSRFKYYIKATKYMESLSLIEPFIQLYPKLQYLAEELCAFYQANYIYFSDLIPTELYRIYKEEHIFRWPKFKLAKLLLSLNYPKFFAQEENAKKLNDMQKRLSKELLESDDWLFMSLGYLYSSIEQKSGKELKRLIKSFNDERSISAKTAYLASIANFTEIKLYDKLLYKQLSSDTPIDIQILALDIMAVRGVKVTPHASMHLFAKKQLGLKPEIVKHSRKKSQTNINVVTNQRNILYFTRNEISNTSKSLVKDRPEEFDIAFKFFVDESKAEYKAPSGKEYKCDNFQTGYNYTDLFYIFAKLKKQRKISNDELDGLIKQRKTTMYGDRETSPRERVTDFVKNIHSKLEISAEEDYIFKVENDYCFLLQPFFIFKS